MNLFSYLAAVGAMLMINEESFIENLSCEELDIIARKKRAESGSKNMRVAKLVEKEMRHKFCETYG